MTEKHWLVTLDRPTTDVQVVVCAPSKREAKRAAQQHMNADGWCDATLNELSATPISYVACKAPTRPTAQNAGQLVRWHGENAVVLADILHEACEHRSRISNPDIEAVSYIRSDGHGLNFIVKVGGEHKRIIITSP